MSEASAVGSALAPAAMGKDLGKGLNDMTQSADAPAASAMFGALMQTLVIAPAPAALSAAATLPANMAANMAANTVSTLPGLLGAQSGLKAESPGLPAAANSTPAGLDPNWLRAWGNRAEVGAPATTTDPRSAVSGLETGIVNVAVSLSSGGAVRSFSPANDQSASGGNAQNTLMHQSTITTDPTAAPSVAPLPLATVASAAPLALDTKLPVLSPRFAEGFAQQVTVLAEQGIHHALLSLNPPELGPIEVRISMHENGASIHLASQHGMVREAMTDALPRLRELLDQAGVRVGDTGVGAQLPQREAPPGGTAALRLLAERDAGHWLSTEQTVNDSGPRLINLRLVDAYV
ncbi:MAG: flagellar hook-length control protein FliK [Gammaproteobacteria bacterium]|nr:flagellar hook-length control protein FliK [Gammaproteobacteria bacterium]